jgi:hypothetical protein
MGDVPTRVVVGRMLLVSAGLASELRQVTTQLGVPHAIVMATSAPATRTWYPPWC